MASTKVTCENKAKHRGLARSGKPCPYCKKTFGHTPDNTTRTSGAPRGWEDPKPRDIFLAWIKAGNSDARACRQAGWHPDTLISWKRWVRDGVDSGGRKVPPPDTLIQFLREYADAKDDLHNAAIKALNSLVRKKEHFPAVRMSLERDPEWRPRSVLEHTSPPGEGITIHDVRVAVERATVEAPQRRDKSVA